MAAPDSLPFYQQFFSESLFILPEGPAATAPAQVVRLPDPAEILEATSGDTQEQKKYHLAGENKKGLVLLFSLPADQFAALPQHSFLTKILAAIQHTPADVAYVNLVPGYKLNLYHLSRETEVRQVVAFGPELLDLDAGHKINLYKPAAIGQIPLLLADPLAQIELEVNRKKYLWSGLQAIFLK